MLFIFKPNISLILYHVPSTLVSTCDALSHSISSQLYNPMFITIADLSETEHNGLYQEVVRIPYS